MRPFFYIIMYKYSIPYFHTNMRTCSRCKETKDISCFSKRSDRPSGVQSKCKECEKIYRRMYYKPHEKIRQKLKISDDLYEDLMKNENCQICDAELTKKCIDHCHSTNKIRGVLCNNCNTALGLVGDNVDTLHKMINYLGINT